MSNAVGRESPAAVAELDLPTTSSVLGVIAERAGGRLYEVFWGGHRDTYRRSLRTGVLEGFERYAGLAREARKLVTIHSNRSGRSDDY